MKRIQVTLFAIALTLQLGGCETTTALWKASTTGVNLSASGDPGIVHDDQILIRSEQALRIALDTFDTFLKVEYDNRELVGKIPGAHQTAENIRKNGKHWIKSLEKAHDVYRDNRTSQNHANLVTAYKVIQAAIEESKSYIKKAAEKGA
jgi:hypothetical protein